MSRGARAAAVVTLRRVGGRAAATARGDGSAPGPHPSVNSADARADDDAMETADE